jgi:hypothetical protein
MPIPVLDEFIAYGKVGWGVVSYLWRWARRNKRNLTPQDRLALRTKWKPTFEQFLLDRRQKKLNQDVIIRDMRRMDHYPGHSAGRGISSWFRCGLIGTYEKGIMVGLSWEGVVQDIDGVRVIKPGERQQTTLMRTGFIPYENVESVDWTGDQYYPYPHIYCYFDVKGMPYERIGFADRWNTKGYEHYGEVTDLTY